MWDPVIVLACIIVRHDGSIPLSTNQPSLTKTEFPIIIFTCPSRIFAVVQTPHIVTNFMSQCVIRRTQLVPHIYIKSTAFKTKARSVHCTRQPSIVTVRGEQADQVSSILITQGMCIIHIPITFGFQPVQINIERTGWSITHLGHMHYPQLDRNQTFTIAKIGVCHGTRNRRLHICRATGF